MKIMKNAGIVLFSLLSLSLFSACEQTYDDEGVAVPEIGLDGYKETKGSLTRYTADDEDFTTCVWADEFNGSELDSKIWSYQTGSGIGGNGEQQNYTNENTKVSNGYLRITVDNNLNSSRIHTNGKVDFMYGRLVGRIRLVNTGRGSWPAFWMLGTRYSSIGWPACGEIDIMEHANTDEYISSTLHWNSNSSTTSKNYTDPSSGSSSQYFDVSQWHNYGLIWTADRIQFTLDGKVINSQAMSGVKKETFNNPFYFILNYAAGGNFVGVYSGWTNRPWYMDVDFIRVYQ